MEVFKYDKGEPTLRPQDTSALRHFGTTKLMPKFKPNHRWSWVSSELSWVEVSRLFLDHSNRVEMSRTTFLVSKCRETGAEVSQSVLMPKCPVTSQSERDWLLVSGREAAGDYYVNGAVRTRESNRPVNACVRRPVRTWSLCGVSFMIMVQVWQLTFVCWLCLTSGDVGRAVNLCRASHIENQRRCCCCSKQKSAALFCDIFISILRLIVDFCFTSFFPANVLGWLRG